MKCELCDKILTEEDKENDSNGRCNECYEEWGDSYPDRI